MRLPDTIETLVANAGARVRAFPWWLKPFLQRGVIGITLGRTVFLSEKFVQRPQAEVERLVRHELVHVRQVGQLGLLRFLWKYLAEYIGNLRKGMSHNEAYRRVSFEEEAYRAEAQEVG